MALYNGLSHCTASLIARLDADDLFDPGWFEIQMAYLAANPDCVAVFGGAVYIDEQGGLTRAKAKPPSSESADAGWVPARDPYLIQSFLQINGESYRLKGKRIEGIVPRMARP